MAIKSKLIFSYLAQFYVVFLTIYVAPKYIKYLGMDFYGLIGFFTIAQVWMQLLDFGSTGLISRESAKVRYGSLDRKLFSRLFSVVEKYFFFTAVTLIACVFLFQNKVSKLFFNNSINYLEDDHKAIVYLLITVVLRWVSGLYRSHINGSEEISWISLFNIISGTFRTLFSLFLIIFYKFTAADFFLYQIILGVIELLIIYEKSNSLDAKNSKSLLTSFENYYVVDRLKFALKLAFSGFIWIVLTQLDKLYLSSVLSLKEFGILSVALTISNGIYLLTNPIGNIALTRMTSVYDEKEKLIHIYELAFQFLVVIIFPVSLCIILFSKELIYIWLGDIDIAMQASKITSLYVIGNFFMIGMAYVSYLQISAGRLRYHIIGEVAYFFAIVPSFLFAGQNYGMLGVGYVWALYNGIYFLIWSSVIHRKFLGNFHAKWMIKQVLPPVLIVSCVLLAIKINIELPNDRAGSAIYLTLITLLLSIIGVLTSTKIKFTIKQFLSK